jgi:hypothetical protein
MVCEIPTEVLVIIASHVAFSDGDESLVRVYSLENMSRTNRQLRAACAAVVHPSENKIVNMIRKYDFASPGRIVEDTDVTPENAGIDKSRRRWTTFIPDSEQKTVVFGTVSVNGASSCERFLKFMGADADGDDPKCRSDVLITSAMVSRNATIVPQRRAIRSGAFASCIYLHLFKIDISNLEIAILDMYRLRILRLRDVYITQSLLEVLARHHVKFGTLEVLDIVGIDHVVPASSDMFSKAFDRAGLEVRVTSTKSRSNGRFDDFLSSASRIRRLDLANTKLLSHPPRFKATLSYALESLDLSCNDSVCDISSISRLEKLAVLNVDFCNRLVDLAGAEHVKVISARGCPVASYDGLRSAKFLAVGALGSMFTGYPTMRFQERMRSLLSSIDGLSKDFPVRVASEERERAQGCLTTIVLSDVDGDELLDHVFLYEVSHIHHVVLDSSKIFRGIRSAHPSVTQASLPPKYLNYDSLPLCRTPILPSGLPCSCHEGIIMKS